MKVLTTRKTHGGAKMTLLQVLNTMNSNSDLIVRYGEGTIWDVAEGSVTESFTLGNHKVKNWLTCTTEQFLDRFNVKDITVRNGYVCIVINPSSVTLEQAMRLDRFANNAACAELFGF